MVFRLILHKTCQPNFMCILKEGAGKPSGEGRWILELCPSENFKMTKHSMLHFTKGPALAVHLMEGNLREVAMCGLLRLDGFKKIMCLPFPAYQVSL